jgi:hypothetical protein
LKFHQHRHAESFQFTTVVGHWSHSIGDYGPVLAVFQHLYSNTTVSQIPPQSLGNHVSQIYCLPVVKVHQRLRTTKLIELLEAHSPHANDVEIEGQISGVQGHSEMKHMPVNGVLVGLRRDLTMMYPLDLKLRNQRSHCAHDLFNQRMNIDCFSKQGSVLTHAAHAQRRDMTVQVCEKMRQRHRAGTSLKHQRYVAQ